MESLTQEKIIDFLTHASQTVTTPTQLFLLGGSALVLLGHYRPTQDLDYLGDDMEKNTFQLSLETLAQHLHIVLEPVPLDKFVPFDADSAKRHIFYRRFGLLEVYILDPYMIALSKLDRGFASDLDDLRFLINKGLIKISVLETLLAKAGKLAHAYDLDLQEMQKRLIFLQN